MDRGVRVTSARLARASILFLAGSMLFGACDSTDVAPSVAPSKAAFVGRLDSVTVTTTARILGCAPFAPPGSVHVAVTASTANLFVDRITIQMIDGTHLGGPMVTFARPQLTSMFGTTMLIPGQTSVFVLQPAFGCAVFSTGSLRTQALVANDRGAAFWVTASSGP
jgi:hypothetical protein